MADAICYGSRDGGAQLASHHQVGAYDTDTLIGALEGLHHFSAAEGRLCGTGCPPHRSRMMRAWLAGSGPGWW